MAQFNGTEADTYVVAFLLANHGDAPTVHLTRCKGNVRRFITGHLEGAVSQTAGRIIKVISVTPIVIDPDDEVLWATAMIEELKEGGEWPEASLHEEVEVS